MSIVCLSGYFLSNCDEERVNFSGVKNNCLSPVSTVAAQAHCRPRFKMSNKSLVLPDNCLGVLLFSALLSPA